MFLLLDVVAFCIVFLAVHWLRHGHIEISLEGVPYILLPLTVLLIVNPGVTDDIGEIYKKADVFVSSSRYESFGLAAAEAMAYEVPCVGFKNCPGINEIVIPHHNGLLTEGPENPEALACQMKILAQDDSMRKFLGGNARIYMQKFHVNQVLAKWEHLIVTVANR